MNMGVDEPGHDPAFPAVDFPSPLNSRVHRNNQPIRDTNIADRKPARKNVENLAPFKNEIARRFTSSGRYAFLKIRPHRVNYARKSEYIS